MILMELDDLPRIGVHNLNNIYNTDDAVLMAVLERKKKKKTISKGSWWKKGLTISFNMTECLLVSKRGKPRCELHIGDDKLNKYQNSNILPV